MIAEQLRLEEESRDAGIRRFKRATEGKPIGGTVGGRLKIDEAVQLVAPAIHEYMSYTGPGRGGKMRAWFRALELSPEAIAYVALRSIISGASTTKGVTRATLGSSIHRALVNESNYQLFKTTHKAYLDTIEKDLAIHSSSPARRLTVINRSRRKLLIERPLPSLVDQCKAGLMILEMVLGVTNMFYSPHKTNVVLPHQDLIDAVEEINERASLLTPMKWPMVVPPVPWTGPRDGGYLSISSGLIGNKRLKAVRVSDRILDVINTIQATPWQINKEVFHVFETMLRSGYDGAGIVTIGDRPVKPWNEGEWETYKEEHPTEYLHYKQRTTEWYKTKARLSSPMVVQEMVKGIAKKFAKYDKIWFVWWMDWRGRVYPSGQLLNPQAEDYARSLLRFAEGKPLGKRGAYWLAVHLANSWGVDKVSFDDRVKWTEENTKMILSVAEHPFDDARWEDADKPWAFLAACFEWRGYKEQGESFESHLPIPMDGTCSGLQHYSALLRDKEGAKAVNLINSETPNDIYADVAERLKKRLKDELEGDGKTIREEAIRILSKDNTGELPESRVTEKVAELKGIARGWLAITDRKIAKRATMTTPYGVTVAGIGDQLEDLIKTDKIEIPGVDTNDKQTLRTACRFIGPRLRCAVSDVVIGAAVGMAWIQECAHLLGTYKVHLAWTSPMGLKVIQNYRKSNTKRYELYVGSVAKKVTLKLPIDEPKVGKSVQGSAPNIIHSLDASHLMLSVEMMASKGIRSFSLIHDSFGTHASDIDELHLCTREAFSEMYSKNIIADLNDQWRRLLDENDLQGVDLPEMPTMGELDVVSEIPQANYMFG